MRTWSAVAAVAVVLAVGTSTYGQALNFADLLAMLGETGGTTGGNGTSGTSGTTGGGTQGGGQAGDDGGGGTDERLPIAQVSLRAARNNRPGLWVGSAIADYNGLTAHVGNLGPYDDIPFPEVEETQRVLPTIVNDLLGSFFDILNTAIGGLSLFVQLQSGLSSSGSATGGIDINTLIQQLLQQSSRTTTEGAEAPIMIGPELPGEEPAASQSIVVPVFPTR